MYALKILQPHPQAKKKPKKKHLYVLLNFCFGYIFSMQSNLIKIILNDIYLEIVKCHHK